MSKQQERLKKQIDEKRAITDLKNSDGGRLMIKHLKELYTMYVMAAVAESPEYSKACDSIQRTLSFMQQTINAGDAAERILTSIEHGHVDDDY